MRTSSFAPHGLLPNSRNNVNCHHTHSIISPLLQELDFVMMALGIAPEAESEAESEAQSEAPSQAQSEDPILLVIPPRHCSSSPALTRRNVSVASLASSSDGRQTPPPLASPAIAGRSVSFASLASPGDGRPKSLALAVASMGQAGASPRNWAAIVAEPAWGSSSNAFLDTHSRHSASGDRSICSTPESRQVAVKKSSLARAKTHTGATGATQPHLQTESGAHQPAGRSERPNQEEHGGAPGVHYLGATNLGVSPSAPPPGAHPSAGASSPGALTCGMSPGGPPTFPLGKPRPSRPSAALGVRNSASLGRGGYLRHAKSDLTAKNPDERERLIAERWGGIK